MNSRLASDPEFANVNRFGDGFFDLAAGPAFAIQAGFAVLFLAATAAVLRRSIKTALARLDRDRGDSELREHLRLREVAGTVEPPSRRSSTESAPITSPPRSSGTTSIVWGT